MIGKVLRRLHYVTYVFRPRTWRWIAAKVDYAVIDHLRPLSELRTGSPCEIHPSVSLRHARNIEIGSHTRIQPNAVLWASPNAKIVIGDNTGLGPGAKLFASNHQFKAGEPYHKQPWTERDIRIGNDVWVGAGTIIVAGVTIGDQCVIAAGSVVTKDIPPGVVAAGVPARVLKER